MLKTENQYEFLISLDFVKALGKMGSLDFENAQMSKNGIYFIPQGQTIYAIENDYEIYSIISGKRSLDKANSQSLHKVMVQKDPQYLESLEEFYTDQVQIEINTLRELIIPQEQ